MVEAKKAKLLKAINIALSCVIALLVIILILLIFFFSPMTVEGVSMIPNLHEGDRVLIQKTCYNLKYEDIVVFERITEDGDKKTVIKRVIGIEGDVLRFDGSSFYRNEERLEETYLDSLVYSDSYLLTSSVKDLLNGEGLTVGEGEVFCLGDNRNLSLDCHVYGAVSIKQLVGKVILVY